MANEIVIEGLNGFLRDMRNAPKELNSEIRREAKGIAEGIASDARARANTRQLGFVAPSIKAVSDRIPVVKLGQGKITRSSGTKVDADRVYRGADFGSNRLPQFPPARKGGRLFYPAVAGREREIADAYLDMVERVFKGSGL